MSYNHKRYQILCLLLFLSCANALIAQEVNSLSSLDKLKGEQLSAMHNNAAGMALENAQWYTVVGLSGALQKGDYHRAMEGKKLYDLSAMAEGAVQLNGYHLWGRFQYDREIAKEVGYNASLIRPYRDLPYFVADENHSDWRNQLYQLEFKAGTPVYHRLLSFGLAAGYSAEQGAKQRDVRSHNNAMSLYLQPSLLLFFNKETQLSFLLKYATYKEESRMQNINIYVEQPYYEMFGMGGATARIGSGRVTNYIRNSVGGELQYNIDTDWRTMFYLGFESSVEDAEISFTVPQRTGSLLADASFAGLTLQSKGSPSQHTLSLRYDVSKHKGIQYIVKYDNTEAFKGYIELSRSGRYLKHRNHLEASYQWSWNSQHPYEWLLGLNGAVTQTSEQYILPHSEYGYSMASIMGEVRKVFVFDSPSTPTLDLSLTGGRLWVFDSNIDLKQQYVNSFVAEHITLPDYHYMVADGWKGALSVSYAQKPVSSSRAMLYLKARLGYSHPLNSSLGHRTSALCSLGCFF